MRSVNVKPWQVEDIFSKRAKELLKERLERSKRNEQNRRVI